MPAPLTLALPKGRLLDPALQLLSAMGIRGLEADTRRLLLTDPSRDLRFIFLKPADIPTYVEYGAADLGIVGKDILLEQERRAISEHGPGEIAKLKDDIQKAPSAEVKGRLQSNLAQAESYLQELKQLKPTLPTRTVSKTVTLQEGGREIQLHVLGRGHTNGDLYIADQGNNRVRRVDTDGVISTVAGNGR